MRFELPVIWRVEGATHAGRLTLDDERITLTAKTETLAFDTAAVEAFAIERAPAQRLRGMPVLAVTTGRGEVVRVASLGGGGSLQELASLVGAGQLAATGT